MTKNNRISNLVDKLFADLGIDFFDERTNNIRNSRIVLVKDDGEEEVIREKKDGSTIIFKNENKTIL